MRKAIPVNFMTMAGGLLLTENNYQRTIASVTSQVKNMEIPDMTQGQNSIERTVKPKESALPYRYIPAANPKV